MRTRGIVAHVRRLRATVSSFADVWLLARMLGWSLVLPVLKRLVALPRLVALLHRDPGVPQRDPRREEVVAELSAWAFRSRPAESRDNCLDRSLVAYRYLGRAGAMPSLVVGIARGEPVSGHVWVTVDGHPVHDDPERVAAFSVITAFGADGRVSVLEQ